MINETYSFLKKKPLGVLEIITILSNFVVYDYFEQWPFLPSVFWWSLWQMEELSKMAKNHYCCGNFFSAMKNKIFDAKTYRNKINHHLTWREKWARLEYKKSIWNLLLAIVYLFYKVPSTIQSKLKRLYRQRISINTIIPLETDHELRALLIGHYQKSLKCSRFG